jgi:hypothetical protein
MGLEFSQKKIKKNIMKTHQVRGELFQADRETDRHDAGNSHFSPFYERT